ncbi:hypothetical protein Tco_1152922 [Tanacetum coccineum]
MAQPQRPGEVHQDELCPLNKRYALMDANKKVDLDNPLCRDKSIILANILQNHPLRFSIAASSLVPWIYLGQTIFHLPQATDNNHDHFVPAPNFSEIVPFYVNNLGFTLELKSTSNFKTIGLLQPWQKLCKMFSRCLTTRVTGYDQPLLQVMQMLYYFVNNIHVDYANLLCWNEDSEWMITDEMKLTENYQFYAEVFGVDVPTTQSQPIESTQGTHRKTSAPRTPNPEIAEGESSASLKSIIIRLRIPLRRSTRLTLPTPIPKTNEVDDLVLQDTLQLVEGSKNVEENVGVASSPLRQNDNQNDPGTMLEPRSYKESPEVEITAKVQLVNVNEEEEESVEDDFELRRREKGKHELTVSDPPLSSSTPSSSSSKPKIFATNRLLSLFKAKPGLFKRYKSFFAELQGRYGYLFEHLTTRDLYRKEKRVDSSVRNYMSSHVLHVHPTQATPTSAQEQQHQLYLTMKDNPQLQHDDLPIWLVLKYKFERLHVAATSCRPFTIHPRDQDDPHDDAHPEGENSLSMSVSQDLMDEIFTKVDEKKENLVLPFQPKPTLAVQSCQEICQRDPKALGLPLVNQGLLYLKKDKCVKRFNPYARYGVEHWKNPHAKIFYINKQQEPGKPKEEIYSNSNIIQVIKTYLELGYEHKFITEIFYRRTNGSIVSITESDYKNLNKNDIEDMYLLIINHKLSVESYQQKVNLTAPTITFPALRSTRVLEGLKSYNSDVKYGYVTSNLSKEDVEYLQLFTEEIEERLKHRDQMRRWQMYVNGRLL